MVPANNGNIVLTYVAGVISIYCMKREPALSSRDRDFFRLVSQLVFRNPFEAGREDYVYRVAGKKYKSKQTLYKHLSSKIRSRLDAAVIGKQLSWKDFSGEDRELIRVALLYDAYHTCRTEFKDLILQQIEAGDEPCIVPFANKTLTLIQQRDFSSKQALRYFEYFYQLRRAWFFIFHGLVGDSPSIKRLRADLWRSVFSYDAHWYEQYLWDRMEDFSTFLIGETGTGKGSAASAIGKSGYIPFDDRNHHFVESFTGNFIEINLSQFSESLIESELFGHQKGAFTGAIEHHKGVFSLCTKFGAIFLDEIGDATIPVQIKLLKVLEERGFTPVGSHKKSYFSGRVIAATNKSLGELHDNDLFRRDFYYRLCSNVIHVPTLRQQIVEDPSTMPTLLQHIIEKITGTSSEELLTVVLDVMQEQISPDYGWPGNVRELEQATRCIILNKDHCSDIDGWCQTRATPLQTLLQGTHVSASDLLSSYCTSLYNEYGTYEDVARITELDPRTVKKYIRSRSAA